MAAKEKSNKEKQVSKSKPSKGEVMHPLNTLQREIDAVFDRFGSGSPFGDWLIPFEKKTGFGLPSGFAKAGIATKSDIVEGEKSYDITVELPGVSEKDISVTVDEGVLSIKGEKRSEEKKEEDNFFLQERGYGSFQRSFRLPDDVDANKIAANHKNGILTVSLPRNKEAKPKGRQISIGSK